MTFIDTSAIYALFDRDDRNHDDAASIWSALTTDDRLLTHNLVVVEACALVQRRLGMKAVRGLLQDFLPLVEIASVDKDLLDRAGSALLAHGSRKVSLVDWTSFELMRREHVDVAFAFDVDFVHQGFELLTTP